MSNHQFLTKSRFVTALECPRKLTYLSDKRYANQRSHDDFLKALAEGGHQVGRLAQLMYPEGILIDGRSIEDQVRQTERLVKQEQVTLFEPTFRHGNLLARVDVLVKNGERVQLIEVKSKGFHPIDDTFASERGNPIRSEWRPYLYDVAFQRLVVNSAYPAWQVEPRLMLIDKSAVASVDGLGAKLKVTKGAGSVTIQVEEGFDPDLLEEPILRTHDVSAELEAILSVDVNAPGRAADLNTFVDWLADEYGAGREIPSSPGGQCKSCEFYCPSEEISDEHRSGWSECMAASFDQHHCLPRSATVFGLWNYRKADERLKTGVLALAAFTDRDLPHEAEPGKVTRNDRHWLQVAEARGEGEPRYLEGDSLLSAFSGWGFPLHFIDFETARPPLPFHIGHRPHQGLLFQFSHHVLELDGSLRHADECLVAAPGIEPSVSVLRALQDALAGDDGTVVHWWDHERSFLKEIRRQVEASGEPDRKELTAFIDSLVGIEGQAGRLADLGRLVLNTAFFQGTSGSSSIKKVLPAVLAQSDFLKERYGKPVYGTDRMLSLNFPVGWTWLKEEGGQVIDPYQLLAPMFVDRALREAVAQAEDDDTGDQDFIANGGAAMVAYGELQQRDLPGGERTRLEDQLKRYCELDTLAMVMIYEALVDWIR